MSIEPSLYVISRPYDGKQVRQAARGDAANVADPAQCAWAATCHPYGG